MKTVVQQIGLLGLLATSVCSTAPCGENEPQAEIHFRGLIDGTDRITITHEQASWEHISWQLLNTNVTINGVEWNPVQSSVLLNSGATAFLTTNVDFLGAQLEVLNARDTVALEPTANSIVITIADTPNGEDLYDFKVKFFEVPTLHITASIDGSDELHISRYGAQWVHRYWSLPQNVVINGILWDLALDQFLPNDGSTAFLPRTVNFGSGIVVMKTGRDLLAVRSGKDGVVIHFADNPLPDPVAQQCEVLMKFPEGETKILARPTEAATTIIDVDKTAAIQFRTVKSALYELQYTVDPASGEWISSGSFLVGNGSLMTFFDPVGYSKMRIYRVVSLPAIE